MRLPHLPKLRPIHLLYAVIGYALLLLAAARLGADTALHARIQWVKGEFVLVGRRRHKVYLPASLETMSRGPLGLVPLSPHKGHLILGPHKMRGTLVERPILRERGHLPHGALAWVSSYLYNGTPAQLGLDFEHVGIESDVGTLPAWWVQGQAGKGLGPNGGHAGKDALAILIHGHGGQRAQWLRMLPAMQRAGVDTLMVTFRNAYGAPKADQGYLTLGHHEAKDVVAAMSWAAEQGYRRVLLYGMSMGGNIALNTLRPEHAPLPLPVAGVLLESPALDWRNVFFWQGKRFKLPTVLARHVGRLTEYFVRSRSGQDFDAVDHLARPEHIRVPVMVWHGTRDGTIPIGQSEALARALPQWVEFHRVEGAKHIRCWNIDPQAYDQQLENFVARVLKRGA